jgi:hypothetical protein
MELVKAAGVRHKGLVRHDALSQLHDVGDRLEYVLARYGRLVIELGEGAAGIPDLGGRIELINGQLVHVTHRLQELLILEHETDRADALAARESATARRNAFPRAIARASA